MAPKTPAVISPAQIRTALDRILDELAKKVMEQWVAESQSLQGTMKKQSISFDTDRGVMP